MGRAFGLMVLGTALAGIALGGGTACPTTPNGTALNGFPGGNTPPLGCTQIDIAFTGFNVTTGGVNSVTPPDVAPLTGDVSMYGVGATTTINFDTPGPGGTWSVSNSVDQLDSILTYNATTTSAFTELGIPLVAGDFTGSGSAFTITETFCLGQITLSGCPGGQGGSFEVEVAGSSIFFNTGPVLLPTGFSVVAIQEEIVMQNGYSLLTLPNEFDEEGVPEPSSFVLLGTALAGIGLFRLRSAR